MSKTGGLKLQLFVKIKGKKKLIFLNTSRDTRATARVARLRRAVWPRLRRVSRLGYAWHSDFFVCP